VEAVSSSSSSFIGWSSSNDESARNLEDDQDTETETPKDFVYLEWWEEAKRKVEEEEDKMLEEKEVLMESFATTKKKELTGPWCRPSDQRPLCVDLPAYRSARSFPSKDLTRLRRFKRPLQKDARPLRARHHAPRKAKTPPPTSLSSPRTTMSDYLKEAIASYLLCIITSNLILCITGI
jgi:hypothetical protein